MFKMLIQKFSGAKVRTKKRPRTSGAIWEIFGKDLGNLPLQKGCFT